MLYVSEICIYMTKQRAVSYSNSASVSIPFDSSDTFLFSAWLYTALAIELSNVSCYKCKKGIAIARRWIGNSRLNQNMKQLSKVYSYRFIFINNNNYTISSFLRHSNRLTSQPPTHQNHKQRRHHHRLLSSIVTNRLQIFFRERGRNRSLLLQPLFF